MKSSTPCMSRKDIDAVENVLLSKRLSSFVGAKQNNTIEMLSTKSIDLDYYTQDKTFLGGNNVRNFESKFSKMLNVDYSISVNSATSGLITALSALKRDNRKEIITTPYSFTASAAAISLAGYIPKFVDIDKDTFCLDEKKVEEAINENTKAILHVSWCGNAGNLKRLKELSTYHCIPLIEDASQSLGNKYEDKFIGTIGDIGIFSFNEPKNITTGGEGGMIVTNNETYAVRCRMIRNHGEVLPDNTFGHDDIIGYNFRLPEMLAAIGIEQLAKLEYLNNIRKDNYNYLIEGLKDIEYLIPQKITNSEYFPYAVSFIINDWGFDNIRYRLIKHLEEMDIPVSKGIPRLLCDHPCYKDLSSYVPYARILYKKYICFFQVGWPCTIRDLKL